MKKSILITIAALLCGITPAFAGNIVTKPTLEIIGDYTMQNQTLASQSIKPSMMGIHARLELPTKNEKQEFILKVDYGAFGGDYSSGGPVDTYGGSTITVGAGIRMEL